MFLHPVECFVVDKTVVAHIADDARAFIEPVDGPAEETYIGVIQFAFQRCAGILGICQANALVDFIIGTILIVFVLLKLFLCCFCGG